MKPIDQMNLAECLDELYAVSRYNRPIIDRIHDLTRWIPVSAKEILQVANDEKQKDWNELKYQDVYRDGFVEGAHWMQARIQRITPPEDKP
jgi:hypothetical protein